MIDDLIPHAALALAVGTAGGLVVRRYQSGRRTRSLAAPRQYVHADGWPAIWTHPDTAWEITFYRLDGARLSYLAEASLERGMSSLIRPIRGGLRGVTATGLTPSDLCMEIDVRLSRWDRVVDDALWDVQVELQVDNRTLYLVPVPGTSLRPTAEDVRPLIALLRHRATDDEVPI